MLAIWYWFLRKSPIIAARNITGICILASRKYLYLETGLEQLSSRRSTAKPVIMYKVHKHEAIPSKKINMST